MGTENVCVEMLGIYSEFAPGNVLADRTDCVA